MDGRTLGPGHRARPRRDPRRRWARTPASAQGKGSRAVAPGRVPPVRLGLALPQYDYSVAGESPLRWESVVEFAVAADRAGYDSLWLSDHLFLDVAKYGG